MNDMIEFAQIDEDYTTCKHIMTLGSGFSTKKENSSMEFIRVYDVDINGINRTLDSDQ